VGCLTHTKPWARETGKTSPPLSGPLQWQRHSQLPTKPPPNNGLSVRSSATTNEPASQPKRNRLLLASAVAINSAAGSCLARQPSSTTSTSVFHSGAVLERKENTTGSPFWAGTFFHHLSSFSRNERKLLMISERISTSASCCGPSRA
jgi:hypothetical protein